METATFGAGCFWGVESFFREVPGVADAVCGYAGGTVDNPTYRQVCADTTGHADRARGVVDAITAHEAAVPCTSPRGINNISPGPRMRCSRPHHCSARPETT